MVLYAAACAAPIAPAPRTAIRISGDAVGLRAGGGGDALDEGVVEPLEIVCDLLARVREGGVRVRVVRRPHEVVRSEERQERRPERLLFEGREHLAMEDLARLRLQAIVLRVRDVLLGG